MRLAGKKIEGACREEIIIPRNDGDIIFIAEAVLSYDEFDVLCPRPKPRVAIGKGGKRIEQSEAPSYLEALDQWGRRRTSWMFLKSLSATPDLEWETVKLDDANTWENYRDELSNAGFSDAEQVRILNGIMIANGLNEAKVEEARQRFLLSRQVASEDSLSLADELSYTQSGDPASELE